MTTDEIGFSERSSLELSVQSHPVRCNLLLEGNVKQVWYVVSAILILAGSVFFLQGMRLLPSQVMYGKPEWIVIGAGMVVGGAGLIVFLLRRRAKK